MNTSHHPHATNQHHYRGLLIMAALSFVSMYVLMYAMVNAAGNVFNNVNQVYMAGLMTAPMVVIELLVMRGTYHDRRLNTLVLVASVTVGVTCVLFIREQAAVSDRQFLRSMIPHHASAILMCEEAPISDLEIQALCKRIVSSQQAEIDQMKAKLRALN
jgi:uncharacterized protein (DUF305 family)